MVVRVICKLMSGGANFTSKGRVEVLDLHEGRSMDEGKVQQALVALVFFSWGRKK